MLGMADLLFDVKMEEQDKFVFDHCGRQYEEDADGRIHHYDEAARSEGTFSEERWKLLDDMLASCH